MATKKGGGVKADVGGTVKVILDRKTAEQLYLALVTALQPGGGGKKKKGKGGGGKGSGGKGGGKPKPRPSAKPSGSKPRPLGKTATLKSSGSKKKGSARPAAKG